MFKTTIAAALVSSLALIACGGGANDDTQALASIQNDAHNVAKANAAGTFLAGTFDVAPDPTITLACPKGSGFETATVTTSAGPTYAECVTYASRPCVVMSTPTPQVCNPHLH